MVKKTIQWSPTVQAAAGIICGTLREWEPTALPMFADYIEDRIGSDGLDGLFSRLRNAHRMEGTTIVIRSALWDSAQILLSPN